MNPELIEQVTKIVLSKLNEQEPESKQESASQQESVTLWQHNSSTNNKRTLASNQVSKQAEGMVRFSTHHTSSEPTEKKDTSSKQQVHKENKPADKFAKTAAGIDSPVNEDELKELMSKTPARIGVGRAGSRPKTNTWLRFRFDHAAAVDAVYGEVDKELLNALDLFSVQTKVTDQEVYIRRPDYGRKLSDEAKKLITDKCEKSPTVQIIVSDGLSSKAIDENLEDVYLSLQQSLKSTGLDVGTPFFIEKGRVAVMDDVGELLEPDVIVLLIGERPGLISAESLSAYLCYKPRSSSIEADRMVISNIHRGGIPPVEAGAYIGTVIQKILKYEASGVSLVQKEK